MSDDHAEPGADPGAEQQTHNTLGLLAVSGSVLVWGYSSVAAKIATTSGLIISFYRLWFAVPIVWIAAAFVPGLRKRLGREWLIASLVGGSLFALHQVFFFNSLKLTSVANVTIIGALQPVLVLFVAGPMFDERVTPRSIAWSIVAIAGTALVVVGAAGSSDSSVLGDLLAVANLFAFTAYFLASKRVREGVGTSEYMAGMTTVAGFWILIVSLVLGQELGSPSGWDWLILATIAIFPGTIGHFLLNWAHPHTSAFVVSIMLLAVPVIASLGAFVVLGESLQIIQIIGGVVVLVSIWVIIVGTEPSVGEELAESVGETDAP